MHWRIIFPPNLRWTLLKSWRGTSFILWLYCLYFLCFSKHARVSICAVVISGITCILFPIFYLLYCCTMSRYGLTGFTGLMLREDFLESVELLKRISGMVSTLCFLYCCCILFNSCFYFVCSITKLPHCTIFINWLPIAPTLTNALIFTFSTTLPPGEYVFPVPARTDCLCVLQASHRARSAGVAPGQWETCPRSSKKEKQQQ